MARRSGEVAPLRHLADRLFDTAVRHPHDIRFRALTPDSMRPLLVFESAAEVFASSPELRSPEAELLKAKDPLVAETLLAWCGAFGNIARTARTLCIHENTVRYRLRRAEEKYGILLDDPDTLLTTWLQLRAATARKLSSGSGSAPVYPDRSTPA
ncbi:helix-turn-helix domain-containing protein [Leucobacter insecticola]|uniref:helix-turn-helix domain-containing protein n=1 Tax=Leucobacter insecticola TaxID=2714934 RepID=UPI001FCC8AAD|nr:helix-turn-helix domain-containing protein [Leucobacter insecticola]